MISITYVLSKPGMVHMTKKVTVRGVLPEEVRRLKMEGYGIVDIVAVEE